MTTSDRDSYFLEVAGTPIAIVRKDIKNLHIGVYPPGGRVRVAAPLGFDNDALRMAIISRLPWIRRKQAEFQHQERQSQREFVSGESHYFQGRRYRLHVVEHDGQQGIRLPKRTTMELSVRPGAVREKRQEILERWYRQQLRDQMPALLEKWEPNLGVQASEVRIKKMKTRWGTCNSEVGRIWLNLELAKKPLVCTEYILVHELAHLIERSHNERFRGLMDHLMPQWHLYRDQLNQAPLAHAEWRY